MRNQVKQRVAIYARFSSEMQNERSVDQQIAICTDYAKSKGWQVVEGYADHALTASTEHRRASLQRMIEDAKAGRFNIILAHQLERLWRNQADIATNYARLKYKGISLWTVTEGEITKMHVALQGTMAEMFLDKLAADTHRGQADNLRTGKLPGGNSYGYTPVPGKPGEVTIDQDQAKVVRRIFAEMVAGASPKAIVAGLNRDRIPSPTGRDWNPNTIRGSGKWGCGILRNAQYVGRLVWNRTRWVRDPDTKRKVRQLRDPGEIMVSNVPELRIVDESDWNAVQALLANRAQPENRRRPTRPTYLLSGKVRCGICDNAYVASGGKGHTPRFICIGRKEKGICSNRLIANAEIEDRVLMAVQAKLLAPEAIAEMARQHEAGRKSAEITSREARQRTEKRLGAIGRELKTLLAALTAAGARAPQTIVERMNALETEQRELTDRLSAEPASNIVPIRPAEIERLRQTAADLRTTLAKARTGNPAAWQKAIQDIRQFVDEVLVYEDRIELHGDASILFQDAAPAKPAARRVGSSGSVSSHRRPKPGPAAFRRIVAA